MIGVAKTLDDIASGKPMSKGAHGSTAFNLASLSDDMLRRYQLVGKHCQANTPIRLAIFR